MRMFTEIGRQVLPHATAVGKAMMAMMERQEVLALLERTGLPRYTANTLTTKASKRLACVVLRWQYRVKAFTLQFLPALKTTAVNLGREVNGW